IAAPLLRGARLTTVRASLKRLPPTMARHLLIALLLVVLAAASLLPQPERLADTRLQAALGRALAAFALARSLDGVISVAQGTEVAIEPVGVGVTLAPGQLLDPVNDLVEQFSSLLLLASASLGVQTLLLGIGAWWPLKAAVAGALLLLAGCLAWRSSAPAPLRWLVAILLLLRFAVPLSVLASEGCWRLLLAGPFEQAQGELASGGELLAAEAEPPPVEAEAPQGWLAQARSWWQDTRSSLDPAERLQRIEAAAAKLTHRIVELIAVFTLESLLFPLLFLGAALRSLPWLARAMDPHPA
ncbi:MAG: hypothetical protein KDI56_06790, partial [Xanthomonadales bacterium]|nr:hypothetical protein [Xanthomonadales bacterium]